MKSSSILVPLGALFAVLYCTVDAAAQTLTPHEVIESAAQENPRMREMRLTLRQTELDAEAQESLRSWFFGSDAGVRQQEQPTDDVLSAGVRRTTTIEASAEILKQFVYGTSFNFRLDMNRNVSQVPFTVPDLGISEVRIIGPNWFASASLSVSQPLLRGFDSELNDLPLALARQQVKVAELQQLQAANTLAADALEAYWRWVGASLDLQARAESVERTKVLSQATIAQIEAGQLAELERDIVAQRIAAAEQTLVAAEAAVIDSTEGLRRVMGLPMAVDGTYQPPKSLPTDPPAIPSVESALEIATKANPEIALLEEQIEAARLSTVRSRDQVKPQLDAVGTIAQLGLSEDIGQAWEQVGTLEFTTWFLGLTFAVPFDNGLAKKTLEADELAVLAAEARRDEAVREIELLVRQARRLLETQKRRLELSQTEIALARKNLAAMQDKFEAGLASYLEVLQLEEDLSEAELRYNQARIDVITSRIALQRLMGTLLGSWGFAID